MFPHPPPGVLVTATEELKTFPRTDSVLNNFAIIISSVAAIADGAIADAVVALVLLLIVKILVQ